MTETFLYELNRTSAVFYPDFKLDMINNEEFYLIIEWNKTFIFLTSVYQLSIAGKFSISETALYTKDDLSILSIEY